MASDSSSLHASQLSRSGSQDTRAHDDYWIQNVLEDGPGRYSSNARRHTSTKATTPESPYDFRSQPSYEDNSLRRSYGDTASQHASDGVGAQRLVIGIDYGTTYTGVAFAYPRSDVATLDQIKLVYSWGPRMGNSSKIPSVISYSSAPNGERQWGFDISPKAATIVNTKLELAVQPRLIDELELTLQALEGTGYLSSKKNKQARGDPEYTWRTPEQVITDYMNKILEYFHEEWQSLDLPNLNDQRVISRLPVDIVITVPVDWPYDAKNATFRAIRQAGFNETTFPKLDSILLATEPAAASVFTAHFLKEREDKKAKPLKLDECFVLCDAGGGTVDLIAFQVKQLEPHLELREITKPTSERCGATRINHQFKKWLHSVIGRENYQKLDPRSANQRFSSHTIEEGPLRELMREFEVKKCLFSNQSTAVNIELPESLSRLDVPGKVNQGQLTITAEEMKGFFENCVNDVIELIKNQCTQVEMNKNRGVKNVFLVGGFGESPYLQQELQTSLGRRKIALRRLDERRAWTAVVQGAVVYGIEKRHHRNLSLLHSTPRSYGIVVDEAVSAQMEQYDHNSISQKRFVWLARKGDLILFNEKREVQKEFTIVFPGNGIRKFDLPVYEYPDEDDDVPDRWSVGQHDVEKIGVVSYDLSGVPVNSFERCQIDTSDQTHYVAYLVCKMQLSTDTLAISILLNEQRIGYAEIMMSAKDTQSDSSDF